MKKIVVLMMLVVLASFVSAQDTADSCGFFCSVGEWFEERFGGGENVVGEAAGDGGTFPTFDGATFDESKYDYYNVDGKLVRKDEKGGTEQFVNGKWGFHVSVGEVTASPKVTKGEIVSARQRMAQDTSLRALAEGFEDVPVEVPEPDAPAVAGTVATLPSEPVEPEFKRTVTTDAKVNGIKIGEVSRLGIGGKIFLKTTDPRDGRSVYLVYDEKGDPQGYWYNGDEKLFENDELNSKAVFTASKDGKLLLALKEEAHGAIMDGTDFVTANKKHVKDKAAYEKAVAARKVEVAKKEAARVEAVKPKGVVFSDGASKVSIREGQLVKISAGGLEGVYGVDYDGEYFLIQEDGSKRIMSEMDITELKRSLSNRDDVEIEVYSATSAGTQDKLLSRTTLDGSKFTVDTSIAISNALPDVVVGGSTAGGFQGGFDTYTKVVLSEKNKKLADDIKHAGAYERDGKTFLVNEYGAVLKVIDGKKLRDPTDSERSDLEVGIAGALSQGLQGEKAFAQAASKVDASVAEGTAAHGAAYEFYNERYKALDKRAKEVGVRYSAAAEREKQYDALLGAGGIFTKEGTLKEGVDVNQLKARAGELGLDLGSIDPKLGTEAQFIEAFEAGLKRTKDEAAKLKQEEELLKQQAANAKQKADAIEWQGSFLELDRRAEWYRDSKKYVSIAVGSAVGVSAATNRYQATSNLLFPDATKAWMDAAHFETFERWADLPGVITRDWCDYDEAHRSDKAGEDSVFVHTRGDTYQFVGRVQAEKSDQPSPMLCVRDQETKEFVCPKKPGTQERYECREDGFCYQDSQAREPVESYFHKVSWTVQAPSDEKHTPYIDENGKAVKFNLFLYSRTQKIPVFTRVGAADNEVIELANGEKDGGVIVRFFEEEFDKVCVEFNPKDSVIDTQAGSLFGGDDVRIKELCGEFIPHEVDSVEYRDAARTPSVRSTSADVQMQI